MFGIELENQIIKLIASGALSFLSASLFSRLFVPLAFRIGAVDGGVGERRMHREPRARIGGLAVYAACLLGASVSFNDDLLTPLLVGGGAIVLGGLIDDIRGVTPIQKLLIQAAAGWLALGAGAPALTLNTLTFLPYAIREAVEYGTSLLWIVTLCNAFNLIDGLDGLCAASASGSIVALLLLGAGDGNGALIFFAATLGFLPHNLRPAKLFLGDSGAMLLGFAVALLILDGASEGVRAAPLSLIVAYPLSETVFSATRRIFSGKDPFAPDRGHLHHRLCDGGLSHGGASTLLSLLHWGFCSLALTMGTAGWGVAAAISLLLLTFSSVFVIIMAKNVKRPKGA